MRRWRVGDRIVSPTSPESEHGGQLLDLGSNAPIGGNFRLDNGEHCPHLALLLLRLCSRNAPPSWMLRSRRPLSPHSRSAIHLEATLNLFVKMAICPSVVLPPPSLSCLPPASSVLSPRRCTLRSGPTRSHAAPPITICEAQHPRHGRRHTEPSHFSDIGIDVHRNANGAGLARFRAYWERRKHTTNTPCNRQSACWCCTNRRGLLAILHAAAAHCGQALTITTDEVTLGCAGLPRHPQPHTTDPLPMVLPRFQSVCLDLPN